MGSKSPPLEVEELEALWPPEIVASDGDLRKSKDRSRIEEERNEGVALYNG